MSGKMKLVITESKDFSKTAIEELRKYFDVSIFDIFEKNQLIECIKDAHTIFIRLKHNIDKAVITECPNLKYILTATTGLDHIDTVYFKQIGGKIISLKNELEFLSTIPSTAEFTWALLLASTKKIPFAYNHVMQDNWDRDSFKGNNLKGKKLGIIGLGRIGKQVSEYAKVFGLEVGYYDVVFFESEITRFDHLIDLCKWSDIITIHVPLMDETTNLLNEECFNHLKRDVIIINTSRGKVVNEYALISFLKNNTQAKYATDVICNEYDPNNNILVKYMKNNSNIIITPHIAGATYESMESTENFIARKLIKQLHD